MNRFRVPAHRLVYLALASCAPATQAALVPRLDLGLRSARIADHNDREYVQARQQRWGLTVFANLTWTSQRSAALIPSRMELSPDAWISPCSDQDCFWDTGDAENTDLSAEGAAP